MLVGTVMLLGLLFGIPLLIYALFVHPFVRKLTNMRRRAVIAAAMGSILTIGVAGYGHGPAPYPALLAIWQFGGMPELRRANIWMLLLTVAVLIAFEMSAAWLQRRRAKG